MLKGKRAYICSPLSDSRREQEKHNMEMAQFYMERMAALYHCRTFASHAYLPLMLDDKILEERKLALSIGKQLLDFYNILIICGRRISSGMEEEIHYAYDTGKEVYWYDGEKKPFELERIYSWKEIEHALQVQKKNFSK